jgi:uncharacterized membrane protein
MHTVVYFYIFIIVLCWTLNPFIKKVLLTNVGKSEYLVINHVFITLFVLIYFLFMFSRNKCDINCIRNLSKREIGLLTLGAISSLLGTLMLIHLISYSDVSYAIAHIQPIVISLTLIIGYLVFNETLDAYKVSGISLVVLGLIILNKH